MQNFTGLLAKNHNEILIAANCARMIEKAEHIMGIHELAGSRGLKMKGRYE